MNYVNLMLKASKTRKIRLHPTSVKNANSLWVGVWTGLRVGAGLQLRTGPRLEVGRAFNDIRFRLTKDSEGVITSSASNGMTSILLQLFRIDVTRNVMCNTLLRLFKKHWVCVESTCSNSLLQASYAVSNKISPWDRLHRIKYTCFIPSQTQL